MKDNKEKNTNGGDDSAQKQPITVRYATYIYAALALCVLTVLAVSIITAANTPPDIDISLPEVSVPSVIHDNSKPAHLQEKPVGNEQSGVTANVSEEPVIDEVKFVAPCNGKIQKGHSVTKLVFSETMKDYRTHSGIDISAALGTKVVAYSDGKIISVSDDPLMGKTIKISHDGGLTSVYQNLANTLPDSIKVGAVVKAGDTIGAVGDTAKIECADAPHLHFELLLDGKAINAEKELNAIKN